MWAEAGVSTCGPGGTTEAGAGGGMGGSLVTMGDIRTVTMAMGDFRTVTMT